MMGQSRIPGLTKTCPDPGDRWHTSRSDELKFTQLFTAFNGMMLSLLLFPIMLGWLSKYKNWLTRHNHNCWVLLLSHFYSLNKRFDIIITIHEASKL